MLLSDQPQGDRTVGCLADDLDVGLGAQHHAQPRAHHRLVVDQQNADHATTSLSRTGTSATTRHPAPSGPAVRVPLATAMRSAMIRRP